MRSAFSSAAPAGIWRAARAAQPHLRVVALATPALAEPVTIVALGDSLTAGYGLPAGRGLRAAASGLAARAGARRGGRERGRLGRYDGGRPRAAGLVADARDRRADRRRSAATTCCAALPRRRPGEPRRDPETAPAPRPARAAGRPGRAAATTAPTTRPSSTRSIPTWRSTYGTLLDRDFFAPLVANGADPAAVAPYLPERRHPPQQRGRGDDRRSAGAAGRRLLDQDRGVTCTPASFRPEFIGSGAALRRPPAQGRFRRGASRTPPRGSARRDRRRPSWCRAAAGPSRYRIGPVERGGRRESDPRADVQRMAAIPAVERH